MVEGIVYIGLGLLLTGIAFTLLVAGFISFGRIVVSEPGKFDFVELLYTVQASLRGHALAPEPLLLVGLISVIRRVLLLSVKFGNRHEKTANESQHIIVELTVNTVLLLILAISLMLLRKSSAPAVANRG